MSPCKEAPGKDYIAGASLALPGGPFPGELSNTSSSQTNQYSHTLLQERAIFLVWHPLPAMDTGNLVKLV